MNTKERIIYSTPNMKVVLMSTPLAMCQASMEGYDPDKIIDYGGEDDDWDIK